MIYPSPQRTQRKYGGMQTTKARRSCFAIFRAFVFVFAFLFVFASASSVVKISEGAGRPLKTCEGVSSFVT
jgi:hypothetical protein